MGFVEWFTKPLNDLVPKKTPDSDNLEKLLDEVSDIKLNLDMDSLKNNGETIFSGNPLNEAKNETKNTNKNFRPINFDEYIGQENAKNILKSFISGTKKRNWVFPHLLIHGSAGTGKTTLARIVANELKVNFLEMISTEIGDPLEFLSVIQKLDGGVLFLDEVHGLDRASCESIYPLMEDFRFMDRDIKPFTLIGATTEIGEIIKTRRPFYDRFKNKIELESYNSEEMQKIIRQYVNKRFENEKVSDEIFETVAECCRVTPRVAISLIETVIFMDGNLSNALRCHKIIWKGYTDKDMKILELLSSVKAMGVSAIASYLNTSRDNVEHDLEPYLLRNNMVLRTRGGRQITEQGKELLEILKSKNNQ
jgi:Holliday junction DNA helicase RuvB